MSNIPFILSLDAPPFYGHDIFPNSMYRRLHARHHDALDMHTLGQLARLGPHAHHLAARRQGELATPLIGVGPETKGFEVHLDVGLFQPGELSVKAVNGFVVVEGRHEEREDEHGHVSRHFIRRYKLPKDYDDVDAIVSMLSMDGVLTVRVPDPHHKDKANERIIQIQQTGPSDLFLKNNGNIHGKEKSNDKEKDSDKRA